MPNHVHTSDSVHSWMFGIRDISFSTGLRLHGNMCSLQCGIPAAWIYHDSRTEELCKTMGLPFMSLDSALKNLEKGRYIALARALTNVSIDKYLEQRKELMNEFKNHLLLIGINL